MPTQTALSPADRIRELSLALGASIDQSTQQIEAINFQTRLLSFNARIEAARAGEVGRSFAVISNEMLTLSERTSEAAKSISLETRPLVNALAEVSNHLSTSVRGTRMSDLAQNNINLVDRNLYERSCDCRWWATDSAAVEALDRRSTEALAHACSRLGVILKAYTVYYDIVLADLEGRIVANGRPQDYASLGQDHARSEWFTSALATPDGDHFGFQSAHASPLVGQQRVLIYSCKVCAGGVASGRPLGVLGVVFNWNALAQTILVEATREADHADQVQMHFVDEAGRILASTDTALLDTPFHPRDALPAGKGNYVTAVNDREALVGHADSRGFETYKTGWRSVVLDFSHAE